MPPKKPIKKRSLGRGLNALLAEKPSADVLQQSTTILISRIRPNPYQPRRYFRDESLDVLIASIRKEGVLMPILLRPSLAGMYDIIAGERRWRASQAAGLLEIPAVIRDVSDQQALELAIIENEQRDDLTAIESAAAYRRLMDEFSYTQQEVAESLGVSRSQVSNMIRLLQLPDSIQTMIGERTLNMGHARPLVGLEVRQAESLAKQCVQHQWSARKMEEEAKRALKHMHHVPAPKTMDADVAALQEELTQHLGLSVQLSCKKNGAGELKIRYGRVEELDGVLKRLRSSTHAPK
ncbi:MAG: ParB/RepB/Spo0J family partition protein [Mariprofundaceae bacterium]|nr:ParB/RepB/Spo0J family partition protein [Mariprofundaceae bacterium]